MKQHVNRIMSYIPKAWRIARDAFADVDGDPIRPNTCPAFSDPKGQSIAPRKFMVMTCAARNIAISAEDFIVKQQLANAGLRWIGIHEII